jgi:hypothetical protein
LGDRGGASVRVSAEGDGEGEGDGADDDRGIGAGDGEGECEVDVEAPGVGDADDEGVVGRPVGSSVPPSREHPLSRVNPERHSTMAATTVGLHATENIRHIMSCCVARQ